MNDSVHRGASVRRWLLVIAIPLIVLLGLGIVARDLVYVGPLLWHITQPAAIQGGLEALLLTALLVLSAVYRRRWLATASLIGILLFLRRHNAELALLAGVFHLEAMYAFGCLIRARSGTATTTLEAGLIAIVAGICFWLLLTAALSLVGLATPAILLWTLVVAGTAAIVAWRKPACLALYAALKPQSNGERAVAALLAGWLIVLAARTANVIGYDTIWYIGQGDRLLSPNGSIFEFLALVSPVHYFPKLWETLLLPLTALDQLRPQAGLGIAFCGLLLAAVWLVARKIGLPRSWRWWLLWILATLAAIANSALSLKNDIACAFFLALMCVQLFAWFDRRSTSALLYAAACAALACSTKLTAIPYVGIAVIVVLGDVLFRGLRPPGRTDSGTTSSTERVSTATVVALLAGLVAIVFLVRTWLLTGVPTIGPDAVLAVWNAIGWNIAEPAGTLQWTRPQVWSEVPALLHDWLFAPSAMRTMPVSWTGNIWLSLALLGAAAGLLGFRRSAMPSPRLNRGLALALALTGLALAVAWRYHSRGSDGNYFILAVALATCLGLLAIASRIHGDRALRISLAAALLATGLLHATHSFISAAWAPPGTRTFDAVFHQSPWQPGKWRNDGMRRDDLARIAEYLETRPPHERGIGFGRDDQQGHVMLPIAMEEIRNIGYSRPEYTRDGESLMRFMDTWKIDHLLLPPDDASSAIVAGYRRAVVDAGWQSMVDDGGILYTRPSLDLR